MMELADKMTKVSMDKIAAKSTNFDNDAPLVADRPVDLVHLSKYTLGNRELEKEVLELFNQQSLIYLKRLAGAENMVNWHQAAHTIKGSAKGIGAWKVAEMAENAEMLPAETSQTCRKEQLETLVETVEEANRFIEHLLSKN